MCSVKTTCWMYGHLHRTGYWGSRNRHGGFDLLKGFQWLVWLRAIYSELHKSFAVARLHMGKRNIQNNDNKKIIWNDYWLHQHHVLRIYWTGSFWVFALDFIAIFRFMTASTAASRAVLSTIFWGLWGFVGVHLLWDTVITILIKLKTKYSSNEQIYEQSIIGVQLKLQGKKHQSRRKMYYILHSNAWYIPKINCNVWCIMVTKQPPILVKNHYFSILLLIIILSFPIYLIDGTWICPFYSLNLPSNQVWPGCLLKRIVCELSRWSNLRCSSRGKR